MLLFKRKTKEEKEKPENIEAQPTQLPSVPALPSSGNANSYRVIFGPHVTEKGSVLGAQNKYIFRVLDQVNKTEIKKAIESLYKVEVSKVNILFAPSKFRQVGRFKGRKPGFKKAVVTLKEGSRIEIAS